MWNSSSFVYHLESLGRCKKSLQRDFGLLLWLVNPIKLWQKKSFENSDFSYKSLSKTMVSGQKWILQKLKKKILQKIYSCISLKIFFWQKRKVWRKKFHWFLISKIGSVMSQVMNWSPWKMFSRIKLTNSWVAREH